MRRLLAAIVVLTLVTGPALVAGADSLGTKLDDTAITTKVKAKLTTDKVKNLVKVHVETKDGMAKPFQDEQKKSAAAAKIENALGHGAMKF